MFILFVFLKSTVVRRKLSTYTWTNGNGNVMEMKINVNEWLNDMYISKVPHGWGGGYVCHLFCLEPCLPTLPTNG